jgi:hypothetical protein
MKALIQTGSSGGVPVPPEKRFLINKSAATATKEWGSGILSACQKSDSVDR